MGIKCYRLAVCVLGWGLSVIERWGWVLSVFIEWISTNDQFPLPCAFTVTLQGLWVKPISGGKLECILLLPLTVRAKPTGPLKPVHQTTDPSSAVNTIVADSS